VKRGVVSGLGSLAKQYAAHAKRLRDAGVSMPDRLAGAGGADSSDSQSLLGAQNPYHGVPSLTELRREKKKKKQQQGAADDAKSTTTKKKAAPPLTGIAAVAASTAESIAGILARLCMDQKNRGQMVQDGAIRVLLELCDHDSVLCQMEAAISLARIAITTNPQSFPNQGYVMDMIRPLLHLIAHAIHTLGTFEGLMALTNLASVSPDVVERIIAEDGWPTVRMQLTSENNSVQRAAIECMCNLALSETMCARLQDKKTAYDELRLFLAFAQSSDVRAQSAATGALAMLADDKSIAENIAKCPMLSSSSSSSSSNKNASSLSSPPRLGLHVLVQAGSAPDLDPQVQVRVMALMKHLNTHFPDLLSLLE
jgi:hypothetical protein